MANDKDHCYLMYLSLPPLVFRSNARSLSLYRVDTVRLQPSSGMRRPEKQSVTTRLDHSAEVLITAVKNFIVSDALVVFWVLSFLHFLELRIRQGILTEWDCFKYS
jgi:hypothetical protein